MAQAWTDAEEKLLKQDPLHDVKDEIQHNSPRLHHVDLPEGYAPGDDAQMDYVVKSHVPAAFIDELKNDHSMSEPALDLGGSEAEFMEDDPLHNVKQELEHRSPRLRHVDSPYSPGHHPLPDAGGVVKSEVPEAFEEELKNDHDIVKSATEEGSAPPSAADSQSIHNAEFLSSNVRDAVVPRGRPRFRISANVGNRPRGPPMTPETAIMCMKDDDADNVEERADAKAQENVSTTSEDVTATKVVGSRGLPARGTPHYRISAHQGMRPGGPLSRDFKAETGPESDPASGGEGVDLSSGEGKPKGSGLRMRGGLSNAGPRRGGLARTGSGVPGEQRGSLARTGSGVPGEQRGSLARTGSGVPGNSLARQGSGAFGGPLARTGSGIPSAKGGNDLKDFSSFLDSPDLKSEQGGLESSGDTEDKGALGKLGEKWNQIDSYGQTKEADVSKEEEKVSGANVSAIDVESKAF